MQGVADPYCFEVQSGNSIRFLHLPRGWSNQFLDSTKRNAPSVLGSGSSSALMPKGTAPIWEEIPRARCVEGRGDLLDFLKIGILWRVETSWRFMALKSGAQFLAFSPSNRSHFRFCDVMMRWNATRYVPEPDAQQPFLREMGVRVT